MWLAHALTLSRIPLAVVFWVTYGDLRWSVAVVIAAAATDALDGSVARWARARRPAPQPVRTSQALGEWLDPLADKVFVLVALGAVIVHDHPAWFVVAGVLARELVLVPLAAVYRLVLAIHPRGAHAFQADALGKVTTIAQLVTVTALVLHLPWAPGAAVLTGALGLCAAAHYVARAAHAPARP